ncbi:hypothetical protein BDV26DRAFT_259007 [Aspergillus bertholletiae]|uniref:Uncharacterized protein n=1 Tax=Aspergillus bertholletiae TaxID=1226010 RepID=A0A5N7BD42_9EURO|nr:hypothetical protein BDV26DRAFT_259007 [Aspergillus bertholletiae]
MPLHTLRGTWKWSCSLPWSPGFIYCLGKPRRYRRTCATIIGLLVRLLETVRQADPILSEDRSHSSRATLRLGQLSTPSHASRERNFKKEWKVEKNIYILTLLYESKRWRGYHDEDLQSMSLAIMSILCREAIHVYVVVVCTAYCTRYYVVVSRSICGRLA